MHTRYGASINRRSSQYMRLVHQTLHEKTKNDGGTWKDVAYGALGTMLLDASPGFQDASPVGIAEYVAIVRCLVDYLFDRPRPNIIYANMRMIERDFKKFRETYDTIRAVLSEPYSPEEVLMIDDAELFIQVELSKLRAYRPA